MADNTIDTLQLEIKSSSSGAVKALDNLSKTLYKVNSAFKSVNNGGMRNYSREIGRVSASIKYLSGLKIDTKSISGIGKEFKSLGEKITGIDAKKIGITANGIEKVSKSLYLLGGLNLKDSKINNTLGALKRLAEVDMSKFDSSGISGIITSISNISHIPDVSYGINRFLSSFQKLANSGDKAGQVAIHLPNLGNSLKNVANDMSKVKNISESVNLFVQSIGRLASAGNKTGQTAGQLKDLANETLVFFNTMKYAPKISENTIRMTQALAQLASSGGKVGKATNSITNSFSKLSSIGGKTSRAIKNVASSIVSSFKKIGTSSHGLKTASFNLSNLLKTAVGFGAIRGLWNFGKSAVSFGSDVAEVQNVVDVAFGNMAGMVDEFAKTSDEKFGLSELAAKQYSGTMMTMLKSSGIAKNSAAEMSTTLAGLSGDIASFYNIDTDEAFRKIRSGIAGEIEPLRQLGISMTVANLEAFALSQGITKSYQAMTQAEQVMLRYNYLMWASTDAQGDFARTSGNFANQIRILKLNFQQLSATIGQGLIAAILPVIRVLNVLLEKLMQVATAFKNFIYTLMGKKVESSAGGIVQDISGIEDAGNSAAGGIGNAADAAEDLKKKLSILPFDQLYQLTDNSKKQNDGNGGSGGVINGDYGFGDVSDALDELGKYDVETPINKWAERIRKAFLNHNWELLGFEIADGLNKGLQKVYDVLNWKNVGPKITAFTNAFTETFNSLVDNFDWDLLGRTIGTGINTVVYTLDKLIEGIEWVVLGGKFSEGVMGIVSSVDWNDLGDLIGDKFMILWDVMYGFITGLDFGVLGTKFGIGIKSMIAAINFQTITDVFVNGFNGVVDFLYGFDKSINWGELSEKLYRSINRFFRMTNWTGLGENLSSLMIHLLDEIQNTIEGTDWEEVGRSIGEFLVCIDWVGVLNSVSETIKTTAKALPQVALGIVDAIKEGISSMTAEDWASVVDSLFTIFTAAIAAKAILHGPKIAAAMLGSKIKSFFEGPAKSLGETVAENAYKGFKPKWLSLLKMGTAVGTFLVGLEAFSITTSQYDTLYPEDVSGITTRVAGGKEQEGDIDKLKNKIVELKDAMQLLSDAGKENSEEFEAMSDWVDNLQLLIDEATGKNRNFGNSLTNNLPKITDTETQMEGYGRSFANIPQKVTTEMELNTGESLEKTKIYKSSMLGIPTIVTTEVQADTEEATGKVNLFQSLAEKLGLTKVRTYFEAVTQKASENIQKLSGETDLVTGLKKLILKADANDAEQKTASVSEKLDGVKTKSSMKLDIDTSEASSGLGLFTTLKLLVMKTLLGSMKLSIDTTKAMEKIETFKEKINDMGLKHTIIFLGDNSDFLDSIKEVNRNLENMNNEKIIYFNFDLSKFFEIKSSLYNIGRQASLSFSSGIQSVHIPMPHINVDANTWNNGSGYSYRMSSSVNWYKDGGLFGVPSVIGVGEAGKEAVLPLENKRTMSMIADSIMSRAPQGSLDQQTIENAVSKGVAMAMMNNQKNPINVTCYAELKTENDEVLARAVTRGQKKLDYRMNPTPQFGY